MVLIFEVLFIVEVGFIFKDVFVFEVDVIFEVIFIFNVVVIFIVASMIPYPLQDFSRIQFPLPEL